MTGTTVTASGIDEVRALTQTLFECAQAGDWEGVVAVEAERRTLLYTVLSDGVPRADTARQALLAEILQMDREVMVLARQRRDDLADWLRQMGQGRSALKAYDSNTR